MWKIVLNLAVRKYYLYFYVKLKKPSTTGFRCEDIRQA